MHKFLLIPLLLIIVACETMPHNVWTVRYRDMNMESNWESRVTHFLASDVPTIVIHNHEDGEPEKATMTASWKLLRIPDQQLIRSEQVTVKPASFNWVSLTDLEPGNYKIILESGDSPLGLWTFTVTN